MEYSLVEYDDLSSVSVLELQALASWQEKYRALITWSKLISKKDSIRSDNFLVPGCEAPVWLLCEEEPSGRCRFYFDSDSQIIKGLAAVILCLVDGKTKRDVAALPLDKVLRDARLEKHLTESRANGFVRIIERIHVFVQ